MDLTTSYIVSKPYAQVAIDRSNVARSTPILVLYPTIVDPNTVLETTTWTIVSYPLGAYVVQETVETVVKEAINIFPNQSWEAQQNFTLFYQENKLLPKRISKGFDYLSSVLQQGCERKQSR